MKKILAIGLAVMVVSVVLWWKVPPSAANQPSILPAANDELAETAAPALIDLAADLPEAPVAAQDSEILVEALGAVVSGPAVNSDIPVVTVDQIMRATVMIMMLPPSIHTETANGNFLGYGMASLIEYRDEILLVTHNHWGEFLQDLTTIELRDAENRQVLVILGNLFKSLIVYQDPGTLILRAPAGLAEQLTPASLPASPSVEPGEIVYVTRRENPERDRAAVFAAVVDKIIVKDGLSTYVLRSLDGQNIQPGDSGGGVWQAGGLVGNNWIVLMKPAGSAVVSAGGETAETLVYTDRSYTAPLAVGLENLSDK